MFLMVEFGGIDGWRTISMEKYELIAVSTIWCCFPEASIG